ncbi:Crp/Fnr family transcriptional regulator [Chitinophaga agrisoli]|uniref:Crp/Fnr family transcriptional regulator n=1 Tax=Chitinophaga agrisoli TaxID=2607653 RepID=A0A5B2VU75_9BACT|nr:Crp/Fnr family transcriptional regulator [Chitinophaga agrisoli]KAA2242781.1 Crp/Fnr family transcriptional regulator [Chitinophaga agrisoli]
MSSLLFDNFNKYSRLTEEEFHLIEQVLTRKMVKKKKNLLNEGNICKYLFFVEKGALRSYTIDENGSEHIVQLAVEDYWIADLSSFITQTPGMLTIEAIEDCEVLLLPNPELERLYDAIPSLGTFFRKLYQRAYVHLQGRLHSSQRVSAEERYLELINSQPKIGTRIPLIYIASYLGITPESLSRIRKNVYNKS